MTVLDYFVLLVVVASIASGAVKGIVKSVISIIFAVAGLLAATYLYGYAAIFFGGLVQTARAANLLGFIAVFLVVWIAGVFLSGWLRRRLKRARLRWVDRMLGASVGLVRGWLICSVIYLGLTAFPVRLEAVERAQFAPALLEGTRVIAYLTSAELRERFTSGYNAIQGIWQQS